MFKFAIVYSYFEFMFTSFISSHKVGFAASAHSFLPSTKFQH